MAKTSTIAKVLSQKPVQNRTASQTDLSQIEALAYQFFVDRGFQHGFDREDWERAEAIIRKKRS